MSQQSIANAGIPVSYRIGGVNIREAFAIEIGPLPEGLLPDVRRRSSSLGMRMGEFDAGSIYATRKFSLSGRIIGTDHADCISKLDDFLQWIQLPQNLQQFHINGLTVRGLRFEIAGHQYSENRYLVINYAGGANITGIANAGHFKLRAYNISVPFEASYPFWVSDPIVEAYQTTDADKWLRFPESGSLGTAETYPEIQVSGPTGASPLTLAHGLFAANQRFTTTERIASSAGTPDGLNVPVDDVYGVEQDGTLENGVRLWTPASNETVGEGDAIQLFGNAPNSVGDQLWVPLRRGIQTPATGLAIDSKTGEFLCGTRGTFVCFFKMIWPINNGDSVDNRTHTFLSIGNAGSDNYQFRIQFRRIGTKLKLEVHSRNTTTHQTVNNNQISISENLWHHLAVTWDDLAGDFYIYLDGTVIVIGSFGAARPMLDVSLVTLNAIGIGGRIATQGSGNVGRGMNSVDACVDEVAIYDTTLTGAQIALLGGTFAGSPTNPASPSYQTAKGTRPYRVLPANIRMYLPFDETIPFPATPMDGASAIDSAIGVNDGATETRYRGGISFDYCPFLGASLSAGYQTQLTLDVDQDYKFLEDIDLRAAAGMEKFAYKTYAVAGSYVHNLLFAASYSANTVTFNGVTFSVGYSGLRSIFQRNLVADGDMELAGTSYWTNTSTPPTAVVKETSLCKYGQRSLKITGNNQTGVYQPIQGNNGAPVFGSYCNDSDHVVFLKYRTDTAGVGGQTFCFIRSSQVPGVDGLTWGTSFDEEGNLLNTINTWYSCVFVTRGTSGAPTLNNPVGSGQNLYLLSQANGANVYVDDVKIVPSEIRHGKFDSNPSSIWQVINGALTTGLTSSPNPHSGSLYGTCTRGTFTAHASLVSALFQTFVLENRASYVFMATAYVKNIGASPSSIALSIQDYSAATIASQTVTVANGLSTWTKLSVTFEAVTGGSSHTLVITVPAATVWAVDDVFVIGLHHIPVEITPVSEAAMLTPTQDQQGLYFYPNQRGVRYSSIRVNPYEIGFLIRMRCRFTSTLNALEQPVIFEWAGDANNGIYLYYSSGKFRVVHTANGVTRNLVETTGTAPTYDEDIEVSGWFDSVGRSINGGTYYGKLFVNGVEVGSLTSGVAAFTNVSTGDPITDGSLTIGAEGAQALFPARVVMDQFYLFTHAPTDNELKRYYSEQEGLHNDNQQFTSIGEIRSGDYVRYDFLTQTFERFDAATNTKSAEGGTTGTPIVLKSVGAGHAWVVVSQSAHEIRTNYRKQWL